MTDTPLSTAPDWRIFACQIHANLQARLAPGKDLDHDGLVFGEPNKAPEAATPQPRLTHRQSLLLVSLAATLGSGEALAEALGSGGLIVITDMPRSISGDIAQMLSAALPAGRVIADSPFARRKPDAVIVLDAARFWNATKSLRSRLDEELADALKYPAPLILLLPTGLAPEDLLGTAPRTVFQMRRFDGEIVTDVLAKAYPGVDPRSLRAELPDDDQLGRTSIFGFILALRCTSAKAAVELLTHGNWPAQLGDGDEADDPPPSSSTQAPEGIRLKDLTGLGEAQSIAMGIVEDLRAWDAKELDWRDVHRGLIVAGPPGCGKTELARAMSREPGIHLEATSHGEWQAAGHLGLMLSAMRKSFKDAASNAPAVLFIDEIDTFGSRTGGRTTQNQSYEEKVIAALLEQLDGVSGREGVVVIGACNHPDRIDPALTRAGRFDAVVHIQRPDAAALSTILRQHLGDDLPSADLEALGQMIIGASGAECAAAVRAARGRARRARRVLAERDLRAELAPDHRILPPAMRRRMALHEAGHAIVMAALEIGSVESLRIGPEGGQIVSRLYPADLTPREVHRQCTAHLAGRAAELLILGDASGGAGGTPDSDLAHVTRLLLRCGLNLGLGDFGHLSTGTDPDPKLILTLPLEVLARLHDRIETALDDAQDILSQHRELLEDLAAGLEARGFIGEAEITERLRPLRPMPSGAASTVTPASRQSDGAKSEPGDKPFP